MANFEAFWGVKKLSANLSFLKCVTLIQSLCYMSAQCHLFNFGLDIVKTEISKCLI